MRKRMMMTIAETARFLLAHDRYVILTHRHPDGDTAGSAAALCRGLRALGKTAAVLENPQFTNRLCPYVEGLTCESAQPDSTVISTDIASEGLLPIGAEALAERLELVIDHHGSSTLACEKRLVLPERAACGEIIYALLREMGAPIDRQTAEALYVAVSTDTGCFKYSNVTGNTLRVAADLIDCGADVAPINKVFFDTKSFARLKLEARLTTHIELYAGGLIGVCTLPQSWIDELTISEDDIDSISGFARSIEGVEIGVMIREVEGGMGKISLRTSPRYDACALCQQLGGGGHAAASGATVAGGIEGAKKAILEVLAKSGLKL